jgi:hypothetical protein
MPFFSRPIFRSKDRASARASARVSARVNARNKEAAASFKSTSMKSTGSGAGAVKSSLSSPVKSTAVKVSPSSPVKSTAVISSPSSPGKPKSILVDSAARASPPGGSPAGRPVKSVVIDAAAFEVHTATSSAGVTDSASYSVSSTGQKENLNEYNGDEIKDSLAALHKIIEEANAVIQAYEEAPTPVAPALVNSSSTKATKGKGWGKKVKAPTPAEAAAETAREAARAAEAARESLRKRTKNVAGKTKEEVFVWATQSLMRELDLVMPIFLDKKYRVKVETMTNEEAEMLAENTEVETLMPVTSSFLRKIDKSVDLIIEREEREERQRTGVKKEGKDYCGVTEAFQQFGGESKPKELTAAQQKLAQEIEADDRSAIVLAADMAEEFMQTLNARENDPMSPEAIYTRDVSLIASK